ncbi:MAG: hypothetical protein HYU73_29565 [Betaproteobacteria bacterium]|nr:hypothetical protein [Betaproteobacteria bacterium]MBI3055560.1 hypothetical protein [Betaproteobacteria bacterium]
MQDHLSIGGIARGAGTGAETIRFYERDGGGNDAPHDNDRCSSRVHLFFGEPNASCTIELQLEMGIYAYILSVPLYAGGDRYVV